jgi:hypothetical protein
MPPIVSTSRSPASRRRSSGMSLILRDSQTGRTTCWGLVRRGTEESVGTSRSDFNMLSVLVQARLHDSSGTLRPDLDDRLPDVTCVLDNITSEEARLPIPYRIEHMAGVDHRSTTSQVGTQWLTTGSWRPAQRRSLWQRAGRRRHGHRGLRTRLGTRTLTSASPHRDARPSPARPWRRSGRRQDPSW